MIGRFLSFFTEHSAIKLISILIAVVLWVVVLGSRNFEVTKEIPIEVMTADDLVPANQVPDRVSFRLSGPKAFLRTILDRNDAPIKVNLTSSKAGMVTYRFFADNIRIPIGVKVLSINPTSINIKLEKIARKTVPIRVELQGALPEGYTLGKIEAVPPTVTIKGARSRILPISELSTVPIDISGLRRTSEEIAPLDLSGTGIELDGALPKLRIPIQVASANYRIRNVKISVLSQLKSRLKQKDVTVFVRAAQEDLKSLDHSAVYAEIDLQADKKGTHTREVRVKLPQISGL